MPGKKDEKIEDYLAHYQFASWTPHAIEKEAL
jgi:hypothetical protein